MKLIRAFPLASIRSDAHLRAAQGMMDGLLAKGKLDGGETLYLDALSDLTAAYEDEHHAIEPASDADMLRHLMEAQGVTRTELHRATGIPKSTISEVLAGTKPFSRQMIRKLAQYFQVDVAVLTRGRMPQRSQKLAGAVLSSGCRGTDREFVSGAGDVRSACRGGSGDPGTTRIFRVILELCFHPQ